ncbi:MAG: Lon-like protease helical domain-containing protein [Chloroflexota bacterium]
MISELPIDKLRRVCRPETLRCFRSAEVNALSTIIFRDSAHPRALRLPAGLAVEFLNDMESLTASAVSEIRNAFDSEEYTARREETLKSFEQQKQEILALSKPEKDEIAKKQEALQSELEASIRQAKGLDKSARSALQKLDETVAQYAVSHLFEDVKEKFKEQAAAILKTVLTPGWTGACSNWPSSSSSLESPRRRRRASVDSSKK